MTECAGQVAVGAAQAAHAVLAAHGEWTTNEKQLLDRAGLRGVDDAVAGADAGSLVALVDDVSQRLTSVVVDACGGEPGDEGS